MWSNKQQDQLERILNHPGLRFRKVSKYRYLIRYKGRQWYLWPRSGRYQKISSNGAVSEIFMGELSDFYHRYLTEELDLPENFGKTWSKDDEEVLYDMIELACTCRQIAKELKRHPASVATRLAKYLDDESLQNRLNEDTYDVPVRELIDWKT